MSQPESASHCPAKHRKVVNMDLGRRGQSVFQKTPRAIPSAETPMKLSLLPPESTGEAEF